jgi:transposase
MPKRLQLRRFHRGEQILLQAKLTDRKLPAWAIHRYQIIALVRQGYSPFKASHLIGCSAKAAYLWLQRFNASGFADFEQSSHPEGRPSELTQRDLNLLHHIAQRRPTDVGLPFTQWSMTKLHAYLVSQRHFPKVSPEWLRRQLHRAKISWQRTKTWKQSHDPQFKAKKSVFWHFTLGVPNVALWSVMINLDRWNYVPSRARAGHAIGMRNAIAPPIRANAASNSCTASMTFTPTVWSGVCINGKRVLTLWRVSNASADAIQNNSGFMS